MSSLPTFQHIVPVRNPGDIIRAQHLNLLDQQDSTNWNQWFNYITNTQLGGEYIQDNTISSRKLNLQMAKVFTSTPVQKTNALIGYNQVWTSPSFGFFTINWERANMWAKIQPEWYSSIMHLTSSNPVTMSFSAILDFYAIENGNNVLKESISTDDYNQDFRPKRQGYTQDVGGPYTGDLGVYQHPIYKAPTLLYQSTGQASTTFFFKCNITNYSNALNGSQISLNFGSTLIRQVLYETIQGRFN